MALKSRALGALVVPAGVFQSVVVGGAYGTGREVMEFMSSFGPWGGLAGIGLVLLAFWLVLGTAFEFARLARAYDYRHFLQELLGRGWVAYEGCFILLLVIVLAVTGAAAGSVLAETFGTPPIAGTLGMLVAVVVCNFFGRRLVEVTLTAGSIALSLGLLAYGAMMWAAAGEAIRTSFETAPTQPGWALAAFKFALYNSALVPVLLYATTGISSRREALGAGLLAAFAGVLPALVLHVSFMAHPLSLAGEQLPAYWMINRYGTREFLLVYVALLFMTIVQTGVGVLQGLNERLDGWWQEVHRRPLPPALHALVAGLATGLSLWLSGLGIVTLIARGYGTLAWGFLLVFTLPLLTLGVRRILGASRANS